MTLDAFRYQFRKSLPDVPKIALLGVRGYKYEDGSTVNKLGIYDDSIIRHIDGELKIFTASVDPGKFYIDHPINPQGCARLQCGLWSYTVGEHLHSHKALVQADEVGVDRLDRDGKKLGQEYGYFGINIHSGGPEYLVGRYSAGCQVLRSDEPWKAQWLDFFTPIVSAVEIFKQKNIPYLLVDKLEAIPV